MDGQGLATDNFQMISKRRGGIRENEIKAGGKFKLGRILESVWSLQNPSCTCWGSLKDSFPQSVTLPLKNYWREARPSFWHSSCVAVAVRAMAREKG